IKLTLPRLPSRTQERAVIEAEIGTADTNIRKRRCRSVVNMLELAFELIEADQGDHDDHDHHGPDGGEPNNQFRQGLEIAEPSSTRLFRRLAIPRHASPPPRHPATTAVLESSNSGSGGLSRVHCHFMPRLC